MSVSVSRQMKLTTRETLTSVVDVSSATINHSSYDESDVRNATTTPAVTKFLAFLATLSSGTLTVDLSTKTDANGVAIGTGLRVQDIRIKNLGAAALTIAEGGSNGLALSCGTIVVPAGGCVQYFLNDAAPDMASGDRTLDLTGTAAQTSEWTVTFG